MTNVLSDPDTDTSATPGDSAWPRLPSPASSWSAWMDYGQAWARLEAASAAASSAEPVRQWPVTWRAYREPTPGPRWQALWRETRSAYRAWYLSEGDDERPSLAECREQLARHMPELVPTWHRLVELTGDDEVAARLLTMWRPPVFAAGCTQVMVPGPEPALVRTYDYDPALSEAVIASTDYSGHRAVLGTSDLLWGLVDGMNADGLAVSLTYGGRPGGGPGFAIPLVIRYLLEIATTVEEAVALLRRLPVAQAYNIAVLDASGAHATVFVAPEEEPRVSDLTVSTNHRLDHVEYPEIAERLHSVERQRVVSEAVGHTADDDRDGGLAAIQSLLAETPVHTDRYSEGFGTLYTVAYHPAQGRASYVWSDQHLDRTFDDPDVEVPVVLRGR